MIVLALVAGMMEPPAFGGRRVPPPSNAIVSAEVPPGCSLGPGGDRAGTGGSGEGGGFDLEPHHEGAGRGGGGEDAGKGGGGPFL